MIVIRFDYDFNKILIILSYDIINNLMSRRRILTGFEQALNNIVVRFKYDLNTM